MNPALDNYLVKSYPEIFVNRYASIKQTAMCWGFDIGDGWFNIIDNACFLIQNHINHKNRLYENYLKNKALIENGKYEELKPYILTAYQNTGILKECFPVQQVVAEQIKEKFGTLRFYYSGGDEYVRGIVNFAESMSSVICEITGNPGEIRRNGWLKTLSYQEAEKLGYLNNVEDSKNINLGDIITIITKLGKKECEIIELPKNNSSDSNINILVKEVIINSSEDNINTLKTYLVKQVDAGIFKYWDSIED